MKITQSQLKEFIQEEMENYIAEKEGIQEIGKSGRPYFEDPAGQKKWKRDQGTLAKSRWDDDDDEEEEDPDELDMLGMQFGLDDDDPRMAWAREMEESKMRITTSQLKNMILQELKIALAQSSGGCLGETEQQNDLEIGDDEEFGEPANYGSTATMGSISEDGWENEDPHDAPPAGGLPRERPPRQEIDQVINDIIVDLKQGTGEMPLPDVIALLQQISNIYLGG